MAHKTNENNQVDLVEDGDVLDSWEHVGDSLQPNEFRMLLENKYFVIQTGKMMGTHDSIITCLKSYRPDLEEVHRVEECELFLVFCPIVSRAGTDIEAAMRELCKYSDTKPALLMALHHTFDPGCFIPDCSRAVNRRNTLIVNWRFHEDQGLLQCPKNNDSFGLVMMCMPKRVPVQGWLGPQSVKLLPKTYSIPTSVTAPLWNILSPFTNTTPGIQEEKKTPEPALRLVLMGKTSAKRAAGNIILGIKEGNQATTATAAPPFPQQSESTQRKVAGRKLTVVNTPDWLCSESSLEDLRQDVGRCVRLSAPGPHAFLLTIPLKQRTGEETAMLEKVEECFGEECWKNTMILFTVNENCEKKKVQTFIQSGDQEVKKLVEKCGNRFYCLNIEKREDGAQVSELLEKIDEMVEASGVKFYSSKIYQETESEIKTLIEKASEKMKAGEEREMKEKQMETKFLKFLLPEMWKCILTLKYKCECNCSEDTEAWNQEADDKKQTTRSRRQEADDKKQTKTKGKQTNNMKI